MIIDTIMIIWIATVFLIIIYSLGYTVYSIYTNFRIIQFLKKNNPERYAWLRGEDLKGWGWHQRFAIRERGRKWLNSDMDDEYDIIRNLKKGINNYGRYGYYSILYIFVSAILISIFKILGIL